MDSEKPNSGPILRLFQVEAVPGQTEALLRKFATTSADIVRDEPGNAGYFFGKAVADNDTKLVFASLWVDLDAVKQRFGKDWDIAFMPDGYQDMIEDYSILHIDLSGGWFVPTNR